MLLSKLKIICLLIIVVFFSTSASYLYLSSEHAHLQAEKILSELFSTKVNFSSMSLGYSLNPTLAINNIIVYRRQGDAPLISAKHITLSLAMEPLLYRQLLMATASFESMKIHFQTGRQNKEERLVHLAYGNGLFGLSSNQFFLSNWQYAIYNGIGTMNGVISPLKSYDKTGFNGTLKMENVQIQSFLDDITGGHKMSGTLSGQFAFSLALNDKTKKSPTLQLDGPLHVRQGQWYKVKRPRSSSGVTSSNTESVEKTAYDRIDMQLELRDQNINATHLKITTDDFHATGKLSIKANQQLQGELDTSTMAGLAGTKFLIRGNIDHPNIYPAPSATIAGALGGVLGGPIGAAIGLRFGGMIGTMFQSIFETLTGRYHHKKHTLKDTESPEIAE